VLQSTGEQSSAVETLQVTLAEGPCVDAVLYGRPALQGDLSSDEALSRWPRFSPRALEYGVIAAFAFPLMSRGVPLGALDVYGTTSRSLEPAQFEDLLVVADLAAIAMEATSGSPRVDGTGLWAEPSEPWAHPAVVHHAVGMVAAQLDVGVDEALLRLRAWAFASEQHLEDLARDIVDRRGRAEHWNSDE